MRETTYLLVSIAVMALTTYLIRVLPLVLLRKRITNRFLQRFLYFVPYAVLAAMTIPAVFTCTGSLTSALCGLAAALAVSFFGKGLMPVALSACGAVFLAELLQSCL